MFQTHVLEYFDRVPTAGLLIKKITEEKKMKSNNIKVVRKYVE